MGPDIRRVDPLEGLADPENAVLERPVAQAEWWTPGGIELDDEGQWLVYPGNRAHEHRVRASTGLLADFIGLADASPQAIRNYAIRWGVMELCRHGLPMSHHPLRSDPDRHEIADLGCVPIPADGGWAKIIEPIEAWRILSRSARAILNVGGCLREGRPGTLSDWKSISGVAFTAAVVFTIKTGEDLPVGSPTGWRALIRRLPLGREVGFDRAVLGEVLNDWLRMGVVRPYIDWEQPAPRISLTGHGLFSAIASQVAFTATNTAGLATCSHCGRPYAPSRRPRHDQRRFCPSCRREGVPQRIAKRDFDQRHRKRGAEAE